MICWLNGQLQENATLDATSAAALLGWGVFTTIGIREGKPLLFTAHYARLHHDAAATSIPFAWNEQELLTSLESVITANNIWHGIARLTLMRRDDGRWNIQRGSDLLILAQESPPASTSSLRLMVCPDYPITRTALSGIKTTSYLPYILAWQMARYQGFDEALLLTHTGRICEGARSSVFWFADEKLCTSSLESGCLAGIGRRWVLDWAKSQQIEVCESEQQWEQLETADEVFTISAATGPRSVGAIFHPISAQEIQFTAAGELTHKLQNVWQQL